MNEDFILDFPVLKPDGADFNDDVLYEVEAKQDKQNLIITHTLKGQSFIRKLVNDQKAKFSVSLYYKDSAERRYNDKSKLSITDDLVVAKQIITNEFSYAPQITPSIFIIDSKNLNVNAQSGLSDFWAIGEKLVIPAYARVAYCSTLSFDDGKVSSLIRIEMDESYKSGTLKTTVLETVSTGKRPVTVSCAQDVYDELRKITQAPADDPESAMRLAIVTQILCAIYGHVAGMKEEDKDSDDINPNLVEHLESLREKTGENWRGDDFNPSLAATKMHPYAVDKLKR